MTKKMSWECENCGELNDDVVHQSCWKCKRSKLGDGELEYGAGLEKPILCSTTREIPGRHIKEAKAVVFGEAILGANVFRDFLAGIRDIVGGRSGAYESKLKEGRNLAMNDMLLEAQRLKVDAVVGIDVDYETVGQSMLMICVSGTAVTLE